MNSPCPECGAARFGLPWCGQCGHHEAPPTGYRHDASGQVVWDGIEVVPVRDLPRPTRWRPTATTFGPIVKLALTFFFVLSPAYRTTRNIVDGTEDYTPIFVFGKFVYWGVVLPITVIMWRRGFLPPRLPIQRTAREGEMLPECPSTSDPAGGSRTTS